MYEDLISKTL